MPKSYQILDPYYAAHAFFLGAGTNHGALEVSQSGTAGQLAQRVQRSAFPGKYDQRKSEAAAILSQIGISTSGSQGDNFFGIPVDYSAGPDSTGPFFSLGDYVGNTTNPFDVPESSGVGTYLIVAVVLVGLFVITR